MIAPVDCRAILNAVARGATLTVRAHDRLNPRCGYFARIDDERGWLRSEGDSPLEALTALELTVRGVCGGDR